MATAPLYQSLTAASTPADIAAAYAQVVSGAGGDTQENQKVAIDYLTNLGIGQDVIGQAYNQFLQPAQVANTAGMGVQGIGVDTSLTALPQDNIASVYGGDADYYGDPDTSVTTNAGVTRDQVLAAYANNPLAELNPSEEAINYWLGQGLGSFDSTVDAVRAADPGLAAAIDASRASTVTGGTTDLSSAGATNVTANTDANTWALAESTGDYSTVADLISGMTASEVQSKYGLSDADLAYVLSRPGIGGATTTDIDDVINTGIKDDVATEIENAPADSDSINLGGNTTEIVNLYQEVLGRAPSATEIENWYLQVGEDISAEERAKFEKDALPELIASGKAVDPYIYAFDYGAANNDYTALIALLNATPDPKSLIDTYKLNADQINKIEFATGIDLDQSGGFGAGKVGNDWDYNKYLDNLRAGDADSLEKALDSFATLNPLAANNVQNMFDELVQQQAVTGDNWSAGKLGSKEAAAMDFALRLAENGVGSIYDLGQRTVDRVFEGYNGPEIVQGIEYYNKKTGDGLSNWDNFASGNSSGSKLNYRLNFADDGTPLPYTTTKQSGWVEFREGFVKPAISIVALANPALAPYVAAGNAINAADKGDWGSAIVSGLTAAVGFSGSLGFTDATIATLNQAKTGAQVLNALDKGNPIAVANALMQTDTGKDLLTMDMGSGVTLGNVLDTARIASAVNTGDYASALNYAGSLTNNSDLRVAGSSVALLNALQSGDPFRIVSAMGQLDKSVKTATKDGGITNRVVDDTIPQGGITSVLTGAGLVTDDGQFTDAGTLTDDDLAAIAGGSGGDTLVGGNDTVVAQSGTGTATDAGGSGSTAQFADVKQGIAGYLSGSVGEDAGIAQRDDGTYAVRDPSGNRTSFKFFL
jgi:hypothetical protein